LTLTLTLTLMPTEILVIQKTLLTPFVVSDLKDLFLTLTLSPTLSSTVSLNIILTLTLSLTLTQSLTLTLTEISIIEKTILTPFCCIRSERPLYNSIHSLWHVASGCGPLLSVWLFSCLSANQNPGSSP
jgi:hypothetical protein